MKKSKGYTKAIPRFTPFERDRALEVKRLVEREGIDPLTIQSVGVGGSSSFTVKNIADYFEIAGVPFDAICSPFQLVKKGGKHERRKALT